LLLTAFTLITLDYRSGSGGPLRRVANAVFGPIESAVGDVARPVGSFFARLGHLSSYKSDNAKLREEVAQLRTQLRLTDAEGARLESPHLLGHVDGGGHGPMHFTLLDSQGTIKVGARLVTFGDIGQKPFVPEVPIGRVTRVVPTPGALTRTAEVVPYVAFDSLDVVGVVVSAPRTIKRDSLLPPPPSPSPSPTPSHPPATPPATPSRSASPSPSASRSH